MRTIYLIPECYMEPFQESVCYIFVSFFIFISLDWTVLYALCHFML